ncbi:MAG: type II secretion system F family protein [Verrucomicrobiota bacterium]
MPAFSYKAVGAGGKILAGEIDARSKLDAYRQIEAKDLQPVSVAALGESPDAKRLARLDGTTGKVTLSRAQVILFTEEIADLVEAGLQLDQALRVMQERQEHPALKQISVALRDELRDGTSMSVALRKVSPSFDDLFCNMVAAGELSGSLPQILRRLVTNLTMIQELQSRVVSALIYPAFMGGAGFALIAIFMTVLVPQLVNLFRKTGKQLPMMTQFLIDFSDFVSHTWWIGVVLVIAAVAGFKAWISTPSGRLAWDAAKLRMPLVGEVLQTRFHTQFAQTLGNLLFNGVPLLSGLRLMGKATPNVFLRSLVERVVTLVAEGAAFSTALRQAGTFPAVFIDIVSVGEQTGKTAAALEKAGNRYDKELNKRIDRLTTLIQPLIIIVMAVIVSVVAYSIIAGIFQSASGLRAHR